MLGAGGGVEQQLGSWHESMAVGMEKDAADGVGNRTSARLTGDQNLQAALAQSFGQQTDLGGFAAAFNSLESNEK
jgi:hypothetical protein